MPRFLNEDVKIQDLPEYLAAMYIASSTLDLAQSLRNKGF